MSQADLGNTDSLLLVLKCQPKNSPILQVYTPVTDITDHLQIPIPKSHINIAPLIYLRIQFAVGICNMMKM